jgi:hypothetical protein
MHERDGGEEVEVLASGCSLREFLGAETEAVCLRLISSHQHQLNP